MHSNINKILGFLFVICCSVGIAQTDTLSAQGQEDMVRSTLFISDPKDRIVALNDLLKSGKIREETHIASIYANLAQAKQRLYEDQLLECELADSMSSECKEKVDEIIELYDKAIKTCEFCAPNFIINRYDFEKGYSFFEQRAKEDKAFLESYGYKEERTGVSFGIAYIKAPKNDYLGVEFSPFGIIQARYKMKNYNKKTGNTEIVSSNEVPFNYQAFTCGFNKNITRQGYEVWASMNQVTSPIMINIMKFGFTENYVSNEKVHWFYRPELGLGWGVVSVSCGYNHVFKKQFRRDDNKWFVTFRLSYPIIKAYD